MADISGSSIAGNKQYFWLVASAAFRRCVLGRNCNWYGGIDVPRFVEYCRIL